MSRSRKKHSNGKFSDSERVFKREYNRKRRRKNRMKCNVNSVSEDTLFLDKNIEVGDVWSSCTDSPMGIYFGNDRLNEDELKKFMRK